MLSHLIILIIVTWCAVSVPAAILIGLFIDAGSAE